MNVIKIEIVLFDAVAFECYQLKKANFQTKLEPFCRGMSYSFF